MGIARYNIERMLPEQFEELERDKSQDVKNCAIFHYSRVNPTDPADVRDRPSFRRLVNPTDEPSSPLAVSGWSCRGGPSSPAPSCWRSPVAPRCSFPTNDAP